MEKIILRSKFTGTVEILDPVLTSVQALGWVEFNFDKAGIEKGVYYSRASWEQIYEN